MTPIWLWIDTHAALVLTITLGVGLFIAEFAGTFLGWWDRMSGPIACTCVPCPGRGNDGHRMAHCAECCFGTFIEEYDPRCDHAEHRVMAAKQAGVA